MSEKYTLVVPDEVALDLETNSDVDILQVHDDGPDSVQEKQEELQSRMGVNTSDEEEDDSAEGEAELADLKREQLRKFMLRKRKDGIDK